MSYFGHIKEYDAKQGTGRIKPERGGDTLLFRKEGLDAPEQHPKPTQRYRFKIATFDGGRKEAVNMCRQDSGAEQHNS